MLEQALGAVAELDRAVNGEKAPGAAEVVSIREPIERLVLRWRALLDPAELRLCWVAGDVHVLVDPVRLRQTLENLIVNAREHGRSPITVAVSTAPVGVRIAVGDAGPASGVGPDPVRNGRRGHGLTVAAEFAAAHGGVLSSWQRRDGGTVVAIDLPLVSSLHPGRPFAHRCPPGTGGAPVAGEAQVPAPAAAHIA